MMTFVNMDSEGLVILPTHRVVFGLGNLKSEQFVQNCLPFFKVEQAANTQVPALMNRLAQVQGQNVFAAVFPDSTVFLITRPETIAMGLNGVSARQRQLDVVQLHQIVLEHVLKISQDAIREQRNVRYLRSADEAVAEVHSGKADVAFLMNPVRLDQMRDIAFAGEVMPQKSTDFYPKLLSGLAGYALE